MTSPTLFINDKLVNAKGAFEPRATTFPLLASPGAILGSKALQQGELTFSDDDGVRIVGLDDLVPSEEKIPYFIGTPIDCAVADMENFSNSPTPRNTWGDFDEPYLQGVREQIWDKEGTTSHRTLHSYGCVMLRGAIWYVPSPQPSAPRDRVNFESAPPHGLKATIGEAYLAAYSGAIVTRWNDFNRLYTLIDWKERFSSYSESAERTTIVSEQESSNSIGSFNQLANRLWAAFEAETLEDGMNHPAESIINEFLDSFADQPLLHWFREIASDAETPSFAASVLRCLGRNTDVGTPEWRGNLIQDALRVKDAEVRDAAIQAAESWGDQSLVGILRAHDETEDWLQQYIQEVIEDLGE